MSARTIAACLAVAFAATSFPAPAAAREQTFTTANFALTWTDGAARPDLTDGDNDGVPDAVERMATAFEDARGFLIGQLGYLEPPTHGRYELHVGTTQRGFTRTVPGGEGRSRPSLTVVPQRLMQASTRNKDIKAFAVHEYLHAVQNGYDAGDAHWIKEATASWVEGVYGPKGRSNHSYLPWFVPVPNQALDGSNGLHEYGAFLFIQFLTERYSESPDASIVRELWEEMAVPEAIEGAPDLDAFGALEEVLQSRNTTTVDAWREFLLWRWQIGRFDAGVDYKRALRDFDWPSAPTTTVDGESCRLTPDTFTGALPSFSGQYARFLLDPAQTARLTVGGPPGMAGFAIVKLAEGPPLVSDLEFGSDGFASATFQLANTRARHITIGIGPGSRVDDTAPIAYSLRLDEDNEVTVFAPGAPSSVIFGLGTTVSGRVECNGLPAAFAQIVLTETEVGSGATRTTNLVTDMFGSWGRNVQPSVNTKYSVRVIDPFISQATSPEKTIGVNVAVNMTISDDQIPADGSIVVEGNVAPVHQAAIQVQIRRPDGEWTSAAVTTVLSDGTYRAELSFPAPGAWEVRATMPDTGDTDHLPGESTARQVQVGGT
jgi:hypothetical protein